MKIRQPWMIKTLALLACWTVRLLIAMVPCKYWRNGPDLRPCAQEKHKHFIYAMWHEYLLTPTVEFRVPSMRILISQHSDGTFIAEVCRHLRMGFVRGSSTRGGIEAIRQILRPSRYRHLAVTPDGPRGPRRKVQPGIIYLAGRLGWPIIAVGVGLDHPWRMGSWDRFAVPKPGHRADFITSDPFVVPKKLDREELEVYRLKLEDIMNTVTEQAERAALTGKKPRFENPEHGTAVDVAAA